MGHYYDVKPVGQHWVVSVNGQNETAQAFPSRKTAEQFARQCAHRARMLGCDVEVRVDDGGDEPGPE